MPIRPEYVRFYRGSEWKATRGRIRARAKDKCEQCKVANHVSVDRGPDGMWRSHSVLWVPWRDHDGNRAMIEPVKKLRRIVYIRCTVAHLNHTPGDDRDENLKFLCQWCHLNYDKLHHKETRSARKDATRPLLREAI